MARRMDTIISSVFRYALLFGVTTHVYDTTKHRLVRSRWALCYSLSLHLILLLMLFVAYQQSPTDQYYTQTETHFFEALYNLLSNITLLTNFTALALQWTLRLNSAMHFNELLEIWHEDMSRLETSCEIKRQTIRLFLSKAITSGLVLLNGVAGTYYKVSNSFPAVESVCILFLYTVVLALMTLFSSGLVFSLYIFRLLNFNLRLVVRDVRDIRYTRAPGHNTRAKAVQLETELGAIQRIHARLLRWVVRFKALYQVEVLLHLMSFFVLQVFTFFILFVISYELGVYMMLQHFVAVSATFTLFTLDNAVMFHLFGELLRAGNGTGDVLRDLPARRLLRTRLERCVEMLWLQLKCERLRLRICGLVDLDWSNIFVMTEEALLYVILLIQMDFENQ